MASLVSKSGNSDPGLFSSLPSEWIVAYCDGGSRGNPGPAGYGVYIQDSDGRVLAELAHYLGSKTNNFAEYSGLLAALDFAVGHGHRYLRVVSDSELMVKQMKGQYRVNSPDLRPLFEQARRLANRLEGFEIRHVLRGKNRHADGLANLAMDRGTGKASLSVSAPLESPAAPQRTTQVPEGKAAVRRGVVKNGVVQFLEGGLPEGAVVKVIPE